MTNNQNPADRPLSTLTPLERRMLFSSAKGELIMPDRPTDRSRNGLRTGRKSSKRRAIR